MAEMTILHFASPFAITAPVSGSQVSSSTGDGQSGKQQQAAQVVSDGPGAGDPRGGSPVDARDTRSAMMRTVELTGSTAALGGVSPSVNAVLAAYQQDAAASERDGADAES